MRILIIMSLMGSVCFGGPPAAPETVFFKVSKSLRGIAPTDEERSELAEALKKGQTEEFIRSKTRAFLNDDRFNYKLKQKLDELLLMRTQTNIAPTILQISSYDKFSSEVIVLNQSWDQLLLGKTYSFGSDLSLFPFRIDEQSFFEGALTNKMPAVTFDQLFDTDVQKKFSRYEFPPNDPRVAGIITTPRFFSRYVNTALNKNRRRAAAVFKIFLCDAMAPSVPPNDANGEKQDFETIFPDHKSYTEADIQQNLQSDVHGEKPDCKACHYKLDPLGQVFSYSAATLAPFPAAGALRFKGGDGRQVDISVNGFGELAQRMTEQPEYARCQVRHFWNWFVGKDVPVSRAEEASLVQKFNEFERKPKDFIAYLTELPAYRQKPQALTEDQLIARRVARVFTNCNSCHAIQTKDVDMLEWDMTALPYSGNDRERARAIRKISKALDLKHDGLDKEMPPKESVWKIGADDIALIKNWILKGAPDFNGVQQITPGGPL